MVRYGIVVGAVSGNTSINTKYEQLKAIQRVLPDSQSYGIDANSLDELVEAIKKAASEAQYIVSFGGDGTTYHVLNNVNWQDHVFTYVPGGTGNALRYYLKLPKDPVKAAQRIANGKLHNWRLIECEGRYGFFASMGIEGLVIDHYQTLPNPTYSLAITKATDAYTAPIASIVAGDQSLRLPLLSLSVSLIKYNGFGFKSVPEANPEGEELTARLIDASAFVILKIVTGLLTARMGRNMVGIPIKGKSITISTETPVHLQFHGENYCQTSNAVFNIGPIIPVQH
jgi:diacylglycerol kinase family enzyme